MNVRVNGVDREIADESSVADLLAELTGSGRGSAVVLGGVVVPRSRWSQQLLTAGADIELITAVQGG